MVVKSWGIQEVFEAGFMERLPSFIQPSLLIFRSHAACCLPMSLSGHRRAIDGLDTRIVKLLNERTGHVQAIGHIKLMAGEEIYAPHRVRTDRRGPQ